MLAIKKDSPPDCFPDYLKKKEKAAHTLRDHILKTEQQHVCCYCEKKVTAKGKDSHIEHIRPRDKFPQLENKYENLVVSCQTPGRCGKAKGNRFSEHFVVPTEENPGDYLVYSPNGEVRPIDNNRKGRETIDILNLNSFKLKEARRALFRKLRKISQSLDLDLLEKYFEEYPTFIKFFKENYLEI